MIWTFASQGVEVGDMVSNHLKATLRNVINGGQYRGRTERLATSSSSLMLKASTVIRQRVSSGAQHQGFLVLSRQVNPFPIFWTLLVRNSSSRRMLKTSASEALLWKALEDASFRMLCNGLKRKWT